MQYLLLNQFWHNQLERGSEYQIICHNGNQIHVVCLNSRSFMQAPIPFIFYSTYMHAPIGIVHMVNALIYGRVISSNFMYTFIK